MLHHPPLREEGSLATSASRSNSLTEHPIRAITACEDTLDTCSRVAVRLDVALWVHLKLSLEDLCGRLVADSDKETITGDLGDLTSLNVLQLKAGEFLCAEAFLNDGVPDTLDGGGGDLLLHWKGGPELITAVNKLHALANVRKEESFLGGGVTTTDDDNVLTLVKWAIASGAAADALLLEALLGFEAEVHGVGAGGDDDDLGKVGIAHISGKLLRVAGDIGECDDFVFVGGSSGGGLLLNLLDKLRTSALPAWEVLELGGASQLAARGAAVENERAVASAGKIESSSAASGAGSEDDNVDAFGFRPVNRHRIM